MIAPALYIAGVLFELEPVPAAPVVVNRAPVLTLWAAVVAERLGYGRSSALVLGRAVAGLDAQSKGRRLGIYPEPSSKAPPTGRSKTATVSLLGRTIPIVRTRGGVRPTDKGGKTDPASVERYLEDKFGERLPEVETAMRAVAKSYPRTELAREAFSLYQRFRPEIPGGTKGWGAKGKLDLDLIRQLAIPGKRGG